MEEKQKAVEGKPQNTGKLINIDYQAILKALVLNWKWFVLSLVICLGLAFAYLRYSTPVYRASAELLIKDDDGKGGSGSYKNTSILNSTNIGTITNTYGIDNELEILGSKSLAADVVRDLKLYVSYWTKGRIKKVEIYKDQPLAVDLDAAHLEKLNKPITLTITKEKNSYLISGTYYLPTSEYRSSGPYSLDKRISTLPTALSTNAGVISFRQNNNTPMKEGMEMTVVIESPKMAAEKYANEIAVSQKSKTSSIAVLSMNDQIAERALDYLKQIAICYNRQANEDKNEIAVRTEEFINSRLEKINVELGSTEGQLENYKKRNRVVELKINATQATGNSDAFEQKLAEANTQLELLNSVASFVNNPANKYQVMPSNIGLTDASSTTLINKYNDIVLERNRLLRSASEHSPSVIPLTDQLNDLNISIIRALAQARRNMEIQRSSIAAQYGKYSSQVGQTPEQERMLTQIGRQQEVKSGLYLMLLQKREENSISLAATADKGKLIDDPEYYGKVKPQTNAVMGIGAIIGLLIPALLIFISQLLRYKIEGHEDVAKLTTLPIVADVAVANESAKSKEGIVVHENQNSQMEEIFRSMRTNIQFMLKDNEKVIMFTSSMSGEGKTFNASNLAVSFALLGKKTILIGLDIRKPRLGEQFGVPNHKKGITHLLTNEHLTEEEIEDEILPSGVNSNLDIMLSGPIPPNPTELIARKSLDMIIEYLRKQYDYIIIDTAPVGLVTDTLQVARVADVTVYVCRADYTPKECLQYANSLNEEGKLPNMAIVVNGIDMSKKKYGYYYGYGKYGKYGRYGKGYGAYGNYGYGTYRSSGYGDENDDSVRS